MEICKVHDIENAFSAQITISFKQLYHTAGHHSVVFDDRSHSLFTNGVKLCQIMLTNRFNSVTQEQTSCLLFNLVTSKINMPCLSNILPNFSIVIAQWYQLINQ